jgi:hypothetical protein
MTFGRRVAPPTATVLPSSRADWPQRLATSLTIVAFGILSFYLAYQTWRGLFGIPLEFRIPAGNIRLDADFPRSVRPWAPAWVAPSIVAVIGMAFWRLFAMGDQGISLRGGAVATVLASASAIPVAVFCLEIGAMLQYDPPPSIWSIASLLPLIAAESIGILVLNMLFHGIVLVPVAAVLGLGFAAAARLLLRTADFLLR